MVNYSISLDTVFSALASHIRRDMLQRLTRQELTASELAEAYTVSAPAISKHLRVLERAQLIIRRKRGRERVVTLVPRTMEEVTTYLSYYRDYWNNQLDALENYISK